MVRRFALPTLAALAALRPPRWPMPPIFIARAGHPRSGRLVSARRHRLQQSERRQPVQRQLRQLYVGEQHRQGLRRIAAVRSRRRLCRQQLAAPGRDRRVSLLGEFPRIRCRRHPRRRFRRRPLHRQQVRMALPVQRLRRSRHLVQHHAVHRRRRRHEPQHDQQFRRFLDLREQLVVRRQRRQRRLRAAAPACGISPGRSTPALPTG